MTHNTYPHLRPEQYNFAPVIIGVYVAMNLGGIAAMLRQGLYSCSMPVPAGGNDMAVAQAVARLEDQHRADAVLVEGQNGAGIVSAGQTLDRQWRLVWFAGTASTPRFSDKRAEVWNTLRRWDRAGGVIDPKDSQLRGDLTRGDNVVTTPRTSALALTFAQPVVKLPRPVAEADYQPMSYTDYDPI